MVAKLVVSEVFSRRIIANYEVFWKFEFELTEIIKRNFLQTL